MDDKILESFMIVIPVLKDIIQEDVMTSITNKTTFIGYYPGNKIKMDLKVGMPIPEGDPLMATIRQNKVISTNVPKEVYGFPFKAITYPIRDINGQVIGAVGFARSIEAQVKIEEMSEIIFSSLQETNAGIEEITASSQNLFNRINAIVDSAKATEQKINESDAIITLIKAVSTQSNLLGLNAAIEAARAGESGRGFSVVASEMRKLAQTSNESSEKISKALIEMKNSMNAIIQEIDNISSIAESQASATEEMTATIEEITSTTGELVEVSRTIIKKK